MIIINTFKDLYWIMKICIVHGYTLSGTGSNIYISNLAKRLCMMGHDISIMCQEPYPEKIDFVSEVNVFEENNKKYEKIFKKETPFSGICRIFKPDLDGKLLVYVRDEYDEFDIIKTFQDSSPGEIEDYTSKNIAALKTIIKDRSIDFIQTNHSIMQPYIAHSATGNTNIPYTATLHGSALNFSVKKKEALLEYARIGLNNSKKIISSITNNLAIQFIFCLNFNDFTK